MSLSSPRKIRAAASIAGAAVGVATAAELYSRRRRRTPDPPLPRTYDRAIFSMYYSSRPLEVATRLLEVSAELLPLCFEPAISGRLLGSPPIDVEAADRAAAVRLRDALTRLGPAAVKAGQQLSIRPDLIPAVVVKELSKMHDSVVPIDDEVAIDAIRNEWEGIEAGYREDVQKNGEDILDRMVFGGRAGLEQVASASLGQVYRANLVSRDASGTKIPGPRVAIKVQRPNMAQSVALDLHILRIIAGAADAAVSAVTKQAPHRQRLVDEFAAASWLELDYENEARNQVFFKTELSARKCDVYVPSVHGGLTTRHVLTTEWIDGIKLSDAQPEDLRRLVPVGVELFLTQLLDIGAFHSDPHPGNLLVNSSGQLCLIDFGLCATIEDSERRAMTAAIVHLMTGDYDSLISVDAVNLGFLSGDMDKTEIRPILTKILSNGMLGAGSNLRARGRKLQEISGELNEVFFRHPFSVPPFFALITRGLAILEGIAITGDPDFDIFRASYPYARRRAIAEFGVHGINKFKRNISSDV